MILEHDMTTIDKWIKLDEVQSGEIHVQLELSFNKTPKLNPKEPSLRPSVALVASAELADLKKQEEEEAEQTLTAKIVGLWDTIYGFIVPLAHLIVAAFFSYWIGRLGWSIGWFLIVFALLYRADKRWKKDGWERKLKRYENKKRAEIVHYQWESVEWLNVIIKRFWKLATPYLASEVKEKAKQAIKDALESSKPPVVESVSIQKIFFGNIPFDINQVMAADLPFYQLDVSVNYRGDVKVVISIALKAGITINVPIEIRDFWLKGVLRANIKFRTTYPFVSFVEAAFQRKPKFGIVIKPLKTVNILDIPLLEYWLHTTIESVIKDQMVLPNRISVNVAEIILGDKYEKDDIEDAVAQHNEIFERRKASRNSKQQKKFRALFRTHGVIEMIREKRGLPNLRNDSLPTPSPTIAILKVQLKARNLVAADRNGKSDPYALVRVGFKAQKTEIIKKTLDPNWNDSFEFFFTEDSSRTLDIQVMDWDRGSADDFLGAAVLDLTDFHEEDQATTFKVPLEGVPRGEVHLKLVLYKTVDF